MENEIINEIDNTDKKGKNKVIDFMLKRLT